MNKQIFTQHIQKLEKDKILWNILFLFLNFFIHVEEKYFCVIT